MSKVQLAGNASGTGIFTIASPNSNTDRTLTLPDAAGTLQVSGNPISGTTGSFSGNLSFNSGFGSTAVGYGCRAWARVTGGGGSGGSPATALVAGGNASSFTKNSTGQYTLAFTNAMPDADYAVSANQETGNVTFVSQFISYNQYTTSVQVVSVNNSTQADFRYGSIAVFR